MRAFRARRVVVADSTYELDADGKVYQRSPSSESRPGVNPPRRRVKDQRVIVVVHAVARWGVYQEHQRKGTWPADKPAPPDPGPLVAAITGTVPPAHLNRAIAQTRGRE